MIFVTAITLIFYTQFSNRPLKHQTEHFTALCLSPLKPLIFLSEIFQRLIAITYIDKWHEDIKIPSEKRIFLRTHFIEEFILRSSYWILFQLYVFRDIQHSICDRIVSNSVVSDHWSLWGLGLEYKCINLKNTSVYIMKHLDI